MTQLTRRDSYPTDSTGNKLATTAGFAALSPQQQQEHRAKIGVRARVILSQFWKEDTTDAEQAIEAEGWMDVLETCSHSEIRAAWADYQKHGPRTKTGRLVKPDAGALYRRVIDARPKPECETMRPETREEREARLAQTVVGFSPIKQERAAEIMKEIGYTPKKFGGKE
jgi:hypothetical protein